MKMHYLIRRIAGILILLSLALGYWVSPYFLLFTAFADTANYLYNNLAGTLLTTKGLHTGKVTGSNKEYEGTGSRNLQQA